MANELTTTFRLPNGLVGMGTGKDVIRDVTIRELNGDDEDMLRDDDAARDDEVLENLLKGVIVKLGGEDGRKEISDMFDRAMPMADMTALLIKMRIWGVQDRYEFDKSCQRCGNLARYGTILSEMPETEQEDEYRGLKELTVEHRGHVVEFRQLMAHRDTKLIQEIKTTYAQEKATRELLLQLKSVDGQPMNAPACKELSWKKRNVVRQAMDKTIGGIDMELEFHCRKCRHTWRDSMPFNLRDFFFPKEAESNSQTARSFRGSGTTSASSEHDGGGAQAKSAPSP